MTVFLCVYSDYEGFSSVEVCADLESAIDACNEWNTKDRAEWADIYADELATYTGDHLDQLLSHRPPETLALVERDAKSPGFMRCWSTAESALDPGYIIWEMEPRKKKEVTP